MIELSAVNIEPSQYELNSITATGETRFYEDDSGVIDNTREQFRVNINANISQKYNEVGGITIGDAKNLYTAESLNINFMGAGPFGVSGVGFNTDFPYWKHNRINSHAEGDIGCGLVKKILSFSLISNWEEIDWLNEGTTGTGFDPYLVIVSGEAATSNIFESVNYDMETRAKVLSDGSSSSTEEEYRSKITISRRKDWFNITGLTIPASSMHITASLSGYYNSSNLINSIEKGANFGNFFLISQTISPLQGEGSLMISSSEEWACVGPWEDAPW